MTYDVFRRKIYELISRAGGNIDVKFSYDKEKGKFYANCSDGTTIIGKPSSDMVTVRYGSGHQAMTRI